MTCKDTPYKALKGDVLKRYQSALTHGPLIKGERTFS